MSRCELCYSRCRQVRRTFHPGHKCHSPHYCGPCLPIRPYLGESGVKLSHPSIHPSLLFNFPESFAPPSQSMLAIQLVNKIERCELLFIAVEVINFCLILINWSCSKLKCLEGYNYWPSRLKWHHPFRRGLVSVVVAYWTANICVLDSIGINSHCQRGNTVTYVRQLCYLVP